MFLAKITPILLLLCQIGRNVASATIKKCCPDGENLFFEDNIQKCLQNSLFTLYNLKNVSSFNIIHGGSCLNGESRITLDPKIEDFEFDLLDNGTLVWQNINFDHQHSCVDAYEDRVVAIVCLWADREEDLINSIGKQFSGIR